MNQIVSGHGVEERDVGGPAERSGAASGEQPAGEGGLSQEPALPARAAGRQALRAERTSGHAGQTHRVQLERPTPPAASAQRRNHLHVGTHRHVKQLEFSSSSFFLSTCIRYL